MRVLIAKEILKHPDIYNYINVLDVEELYIITDIEYDEHFPEYYSRYPRVVVINSINTYNLYQYTNTLSTEYTSVLQDNFNINDWFKTQEKLFLAKKLDELI